jgi:hypothetical protein
MKVGYILALVVVLALPQPILANGIGVKDEPPISGGSMPKLPSSYVWLDPVSVPSAFFIGEKGPSYLDAVGKSLVFKDPDPRDGKVTLLANDSGGTLTMLTYATPKYPSVFAFVLDVGWGADQSAYILAKFEGDTAYIGFLSPIVRKAFPPRTDAEKHIIQDLGRLRFDGTSYTVPNAKDLDNMLGLFSALPKQFVGKYTVRPLRTHPDPKMAAQAEGKRRLSTGDWSLERAKEGFPRIRLKSRSADPRGTIELFAICRQGEFILAVDNVYDGHKYFDFTDLNSGGVPVAMLAFNFGDGTNRKMLWQITENYHDEVSNPTNFVRRLGKSMEGEMWLRYKITGLTTDWDPREFFRTILTKDRVQFATLGIPKGSYKATFAPKADVEAIAKHLPCY